VLEEADGVTVTCPDLPEMVTGGCDVAAKLEAAEDALATALSGYVDDNRPIPAPSPAEGRRVVAIDALVASKLALHGAMLGQRVGNVGLAGRLGLDEKAVRRLRAPLHRSHIGAVARPRPPPAGRGGGGNLKPGPALPRPPPLAMFGAWRRPRRRRRPSPSR
jgi:predicted RNase H-like HicB family nuclease